MKVLEILAVVGISQGLSSKATTDSKFESWEQSPTCTQTGQSVLITGDKPQYVQYCVKSYDLKEVLTKIQNSVPQGTDQNSVIAGLNDSLTGQSLDFGFSDEPNSSTYLYMGCAATLKVVPVSAWFKHSDNSWEENLDKILGPTNSGSSTTRIGFNSCSGALKACVRTWSTVFPGDANSVFPQGLYTEMGNYKEIRLEYMCIPSVIGSGFAISAQASGSAIATGQDAKQISFEGMCSSAAKYIQPLLVLEGANCGGQSAIDYTAMAQQQCTADKQTKAGSAACTIKFPASVYGDTLEVRGCANRRAVGIASCNFADGTYHVSATKKMNNMIMKYLPQTSRDQLVAIDRYTTAKFAMCTFRESMDLSPSAMQDSEFCCLAATLDLIDTPCTIGASDSFILSDTASTQRSKINEWFSMLNSALLSRTCATDESLEIDSSIVGCGAINTSRTSASNTTTTVA